MPQGQLGGPGVGPYGPPIFGTPAQTSTKPEIPVSEKGQEEFDDRSTLHKGDKAQSKPIFIKPAPIKTKPMNKETTTTNSGGAVTGMSGQSTDLTDKKDETKLTTTKPH